VGKEPDERSAVFSLEASRDGLLNPARLARQLRETKNPVFDLESRTLGVTAGGAQEAFN
jgi:hypothetical protein